jgi:hypothetical protein
MSCAEPVTIHDDFAVEDHGTICLLRPLTKAASVWVEEHIGQDNGFQPHWPTVVIEPRYIWSILEGLRSDGFVAVEARSIR